MKDPRFADADAAPDAGDGLLTETTAVFAGTVLAVALCGMVFGLNRDIGARTLGGAPSLTMATLEASSVAKPH